MENINKFVLHFRVVIVSVAFVADSYTTTTEATAVLIGSFPIPSLLPHALLSREESATVVAPVDFLMV